MSKGRRRFTNVLRTLSSYIFIQIRLCSKSHQYVSKHYCIVLLFMLQFTGIASAIFDTKNPAAAAAKGIDQTRL